MIYSIGSTDIKFMFVDGMDHGARGQQQHDDGQCLGGWWNLDK